MESTNVTDEQRVANGEKPVILIGKTETKINTSEALCGCPQKCYEKVPPDVRQRLQDGFNSLTDNARQNEYLQSYIEMRSVYKRLWADEERIGGRLQRRVSCKYKIPLYDAATSILPCNENQTKIHTNSRGRTLYVVNTKEGVNTIEVCQKAFMNVYGITEKRIRLQREKLIAKLRSTTKASEYQIGQQNDDVTARSLQWTPEQAILDAFFCNQLWRPEYIGMTTDAKIQSTEPIQNDTKSIPTH